MRNKTAFIHLQEGEVVGRAGCGCVLYDDDDGTRFYQCETHAGAESVRELYKKARRIALDLIRAVYRGDDAEKCPSNDDFAGLNRHVFNCLDRTAFRLWGHGKNNPDKKSWPEL